MNTELIVLALVIVTALGFDFTNGFHDTGNAMATSIATGALKPKVAVALSAVLNLVGAFLSVEVALTVATKVVGFQDKKGLPLPGIDGQTVLIVVFAGLIGAILWNVLTWLLGLPSSSSHALFGGLIGATIAGLGFEKVIWKGVVTSVVIPAVCAPIVAAIVAAAGTWLVYALTSRVAEAAKERGFRYGQIGSASLVSLAHGTGDAQKTMGIITLALVAAHEVDAHGGKPEVPFWVKLSCALAIALGTYIGGWRVIRTLGKGLVEISSPQGMAAESSSAAIILSSSYAGMALSTTHVATGSILGTGIGRKGAEVRWGVAGRMVLAWIITLPAAAVVGAGCFLVASLLPPLPGALAIFAILLAACGAMWLRARKHKVDSNNVNADWDEATDVLDTPETGHSATTHSLEGAAADDDKAPVSAGLRGTEH
ncbi:MAG: inorganic phosphate transporter [Segniliparus sp.]|uniref:inorganic phosphate transporter n=1 Tax=Segniliparus sp. TaxID=2804064 RepID=UPI003F2DE249